MSSEIAIKVDRLNKFFEIYDQPRDRLKQFLLPGLQRSFGLQPKKYFREFQALKDVSFELKRGSSLGILGLNGAGKSTLLQMICGTLSPSSGNITVNGRIAALLELGAGFNPEFTGLENVYLNGTILGLSNQQIAARLDQILAFADIGEFILQPVKTYSSGMYVRLAFAIAIHSSPDILIIDEALAVGDFLFQQKCNVFIKENLSGVTKLFVSHDIGSLANMTDTALVLKRGRLIFYGDVRSAIQEYQISSRATPTIEAVVEKGSLKENLDQKIDSLKNLNKVSNDVWIDISPKFLSGSLQLIVEKVSWNVDGKDGFNLVQPADLVTLKIIVKCDKEIISPVVGYQVQDRFGVVVFGQNSVSSKIDLSLIPRGKSIITMCIKWPEVSNGKYSLTIGVGAGIDGEAHEVLCWAHNVIVFDSVSTAPVHGIFNNRLLGLEVFSDELL